MPSVLIEEAAKVPALEARIKELEEHTIKDSYRICVLEKKVDDLMRWKESIESYEAEQAEYK